MPKLNPLKKEIKCCVVEFGMSHHNLTYRTKETYIGLGLKTQ